MKLTKNIRSEEVLPEAYHKRYGAKNGMRAMNPSTFLTVQYLIDTFGWEYVEINTWLWGGVRDESGLRIKGHNYYRNGWGLHDNGNAIDFRPYYIKDGEKKYYPIIDIHKELLECTYIRDRMRALGVYRMEVAWLATTWIHLDCEYTRDQADLIFVSKDKKFSLGEYEKEIKERYG